MKMGKVCRVMKYTAAFLIPLVFTMVITNYLDNDSWFVLAEGRYIAENGVYYTDVLSMHDGLEITVQQYGFAVIFWWIYSVFGPVGLYLMMLGLELIILVLIYRICMLLSNRNVNLSLLIMIVAGLLLALGFVTTRAQMVSYCIFLALIYILELYVKTGKMKYLWWIPVLSLAQVNLHASVWWMIFLVLGVYLIDGIRKPRLYLQGYNKKPLAIMGLMAFMVGFLNPYGFKMVAFIFNSYGANEILKLVSEMQSFNLRTIFNVLLYIALMIVMMLYLFGEKKRIRMRYVLMFLGFLGLGLNTVKGMSYLILVMFLPLALMYKKVEVQNVIDSIEARKALMLWSGLIAGSVTLAMIGVVLGQINNYPEVALFEAMNVIDESVDKDGRDKKDLKIYAGYDDGGYVEFRGYKAYLDPRAEVFLGRDEEDNVLREWEDLLAGKIKIDDFLEKYEFDYILAIKDHSDKMYELERSYLEVIYLNEDAGIKVLKYIDA